jgi:prophage maintenance system killer protein
VALNRAIRESDEWFDEPDDLDRVARALAAIEGVDYAVAAAAILAARVTRTQGFTEGNKRTGLLLARWTLDRNGLDGAAILPADDRVVADLLIRAAAGHDIESQLIDVFRVRDEASRPRE